MNRLFLRYVAQVITLSASLVAGCSKAPRNDSALTGAPSINVQRVSGKWFILGRIPTYFDSQGRRMVLALRETGSGQFAGKWAFDESKDSGSSRKVFSVALNFGTGLNSTNIDLTYLKFMHLSLKVVEFSGDYSWIMIGSTDRRYLWILSNGSKMDKNLYDGLLERAKLAGFDPQYIESTFNFGTSLDAPVDE